MTGADVADSGALREVVAGLNTLVMLGAFMHSAPGPASAAELASGGLYALTKLPLTAVLWYPDGGSESRLAVTGKCAGKSIGDDGTAETLRALCRQLHADRPTLRAGDDLPRGLRAASVESLVSLPLRVSTQPIGFLLAGATAARSRTT